MACNLRLTCHGSYSTIKNQQLQGAIWETLSQSLSFSDPGAVAIKPLHQHAQELVKSCKDLLEKYNDIDEHLEIARSRAPSDNDWQREAESVERILKQQAGRAKQEITVHLHGVARVVEKTNDSEVNFKDDDIWSRFARVTPDAVDSTRVNVAGNWATVAKRAEKDISRLVKHFSDEED